MPLAARATANPDEAAGLTPKSASPNVFVETAANVIVWLALSIVKPCDTLVAGLKFASPGWEAVIVHEPAPVRFAVPGGAVLAAVQLPLAARLTVNPDEAVGLTLKLGSPNVLFGIAAKLIV